MEIFTTAILCGVRGEKTQLLLQPEFSNSRHFTKKWEWVKEEGSIKQPTCCCLVGALLQEQSFPCSRQPNSAKENHMPQSVLLHVV